MVPSRSRNTARASPIDGAADGPNHAVVLRRKNGARVEHDPVGLDAGNHRRIAFSQPLRETVGRLAWGREPHEPRLQLRARERAAPYLGLTLHDLRDLPNASSQRDRK